MKLIAVDLDGTLLGGTSGRYGFRSSGVEALRGAVRAGLLVTIATGRDLPFILQLLRQEGIDPFVERWPQLIVSEERSIHRLDSDGSYVPEAAWNEAVERSERAFLAEIIDGVRLMLGGSLIELDPTAHRIEGEREQQRGFVEVVFADVTKARLAVPVIDGWLQRNRLPYYAVRNAAGIAIRHRTVGKGNVLHQMCRLLEIDTAYLLAIGDSWNDLSMLDGSFGFRSAVPGNAEDEVKASVRKNQGFIAEGTYGDGVAQAIFQVCGLPIDR